MKNQIRSLQAVLLVLFATVGFNAFTTPRDSIDYDLTEGKILAAQSNYSTSLVPQYQQAQEDFQTMNIEFDVRANANESELEFGSDLSLLSQSLYIYDKELSTVNFYSLTVQQRKAFLVNLESIKKEFYSTLNR